MKKIKSLTSIDFFINLWDENYASYKYRLLFNIKDILFHKSNIHLLEDNFIFAEIKDFENNKKEVINFLIWKVDLIQDIQEIDLKNKENNNWDDDDWG